MTDLRAGAFTLLSSPDTEGTKEVAHMVIQVRPARVPDEDQQAQARKVSRTITIAIAAIVGATAVMIAVVATGPEEQAASTPVTSEVVGEGTPSSATSTAAPPPDTSTIGLPPEDATPSSPLRGKLARWKGASEWDGFLYADGRWIYSDGSNWVERRLTRKGAQFVRFAIQPVHPEWLPASAWEDRKPRPYVPSRYIVVATCDYEFAGLCEMDERHPSVKQKLPARVQDFLRRGDRIVGSGLKVTTDQARTCAQILSESGFEPTSSLGPQSGITYTSRRVFGIDVKRYHTVIEFHPVLPDGRVPSSK